MGIYKYLDINTGTVMKNPAMLKFVLDHVNPKKLCKHAVKKLLYLLRYVPDQYKTQQMCDKAITENGGTLKSVLTTARIKKCVIKQLIVTLMR